MLKKILIAAALTPFIVLSAHAQADKATVKKEAAEAVKKGEIAKGEGSEAPKAKSVKARADVKAEAKAAVKDGSADTKEGSDAPKAKSVKTRAEVKAEAKQAVKEGKTDKGEATK